MQCKRCGAQATRVGQTCVRGNYAQWWRCPNNHSWTTGMPKKLSQANERSKLADQDINGKLSSKGGDADGGETQGRS